MRHVAECDQPEAPDAAAAEFALELHAIGAPEDAVPMEPALHEFALVSAPQELFCVDIFKFVGRTL